MTILVTARVLVGQPGGAGSWGNSMKKFMLKNMQKGFTIVELLIVVVVIGVLAAIVTVAYTGIQQRAQVSAVASELKQWQKLFEAYRAINGSYPAPSATPTTGGGPGANVLSVYCLGTGFPVVSGTRYCYAYTNGPYQVAESGGATLLAELSEVGSPPNNSPKYAQGSLVGPYARWTSASDLWLGSIFPSGTDCTEMGFTAGSLWSNGTQECRIVLNN